jgi:hypothetical protein
MRNAGMSIRLRLLLLILVAGVLPAVILGVIASMQAKKILMEDAVANVEILAEQKAGELQLFVKSRSEAAALQASDVRLSRFIVSRGAASSVNHEVMHKWMVGSLRTHGFRDVLLVGLDGEVHYSALIGPHPGVHLAQEPWNMGAAGVAFEQISQPGFERDFEGTPDLWFDGQTAALVKNVFDDSTAVGCLIAEMDIDERVPAPRPHPHGQRSADIRCFLPARVHEGSRCERTGNTDASRCGRGITKR